MGFFPWLVGSAGFIDRIILSSSGTRPIPDQLREIRNRAILSKDSFYARCLSGKWALTGNPAQFQYGKATHLPRVPSCRITLGSSETPLTGAQVSEFLRAVLPEGQPEVSSVELTRDVRGLRVPYIREHLVHRARSWRELSDGHGRQTLYIGSRWSPWQARIYDKTTDVVRFEIVLRRGFLIRHGLRCPDALVKLRQVKTQGLLSVKKLCQEKMLAATEHLANDIGKEILRTWGQYGRPLQALCRFLRGAGIKPDCVLRQSRCQLQMENMLERLIW
jgi:hypothetical protein